MIFLDGRNQLPPPSHRLEFDATPLARSEWKIDLKKQKIGKIISERKDGTDLTKAKNPAKSYQKPKCDHRHHFHEGHSKKKNTKMNMKTNRKLHLKMKSSMKRNMNTKKHMNECDLGHECGDAYDKEYGLLTRR
jgi:hypothetical protein